MTNSNTHSQTKVWKQGRSPVGRVALIPTIVYISNELYRLIKTLYTNIFYFIEPFIPANLRRDEDNPTYCSKTLSARFYFMPILFNGRLKPYPTNFEIYFSQKPQTTKRVP